MSNFQYQNNPSTTLAGALTSGATSLSVTSASGFPTLGKFTIIVDSEIMVVTGVSGTTFTVERGAEDTSAVAHLIASTVTGVLTRDSFLGAHHTDVRSFGAKGDGSNDDTAEIQAALTASAGGRVFIPAGTYIISAALTLTDGQQIVGQGADTILKRAASFNSNIISAGNDIDDVVLSDLTFDGNRANTSGAGYLVTATRANRWRVTRCKFIDSPATAPALLLQGATYCVVDNCHFENVGYGVVFGVAADSTDDVDFNSVVNCTFNDCDLNGIFITGSLDSSASTSTPRANVIDGNTLFGCGDASIESGIGCRSTAISNNTVRGGTVGVSGILVRDNVNTTVTGNAVSAIQGADGDGIAVVSQHTESTGITLVGNTSQGNARDGLFVQDAYSVSVIGGYFADNENDGIRFDDVHRFTLSGAVAANNAGYGVKIGEPTGVGCTEGVVSSVVAFDNGTTSANTLDGIITGHDDTANIHFADCMEFDTHSGTSRTQRYGLHIFEGATSISVSNNRAFNNRTAQVVDAVGAQGISFGNRAAATSLGSVSGKVEVFEADGTSHGFLPIYDAIT